MSFWDKSSLMPRDTELVTNLNMGRKNVEGQIGSDFSAGLSISNPKIDPSFCRLFGGFRIVKIPHVRDFTNCKPGSAGPTYGTGGNSATQVTPVFYNSGNIGSSNLLTSRPFGQTSKAPGQKNSAGHGTGGNVIVNRQTTFRSIPQANTGGYVIANQQTTSRSIPQANTSGYAIAIPQTALTSTARPNKASKFPADVNRWLSTGMLDGVPIKYVSFDRKRTLQGIIRGGKYICSCKACNWAQSVRPFEFELHAGAKKTHHPNEYIYFQNGKSIYRVVLELQNTPPEILFETIVKSTGSPLHLKNFRAWKAAFEASTQRR